VLKKSASGRRLEARGGETSTSLSELWAVVHENWRLLLSIVGALSASCLIFCLVVPKEYESTGKVELRSAPDTLAIERRDAAPVGSLAAGQVQLETLANVLRSEKLAWAVITKLKLQTDSDFAGKFQKDFPEFSSESSSAGAKDYLLRRFRDSLTVESLPHTFVLAIRFRSHDAALSAAVVNELLEAFAREETASRVQATRGQTDWLSAQLREMKAQVDRDDARLAEFQKTHGILSVADAVARGRSQEVGNGGALAAVEAFSHELVGATADRMLREAEYRAATAGDPELVVDQRSGSGENSERALLQQLHARRSELELEETQLKIEHGPNFPRLVEIREQIQDANAQTKAAKMRLLESFRNALKTSMDREKSLRRELDDATTAGLKLRGAELTYATMWQEANANREVYVHLMQQAEEAGLAAGSRGSALSVIDHARQPARPSFPNLPVDMAITVFVAFWVGLAAVLCKDGLQKKRVQAALLMVFAVSCVGIGYGQAPMPSTSGLPTGVARIPQSSEMKSTPDVKDAPAVWGTGRAAAGTGLPGGTTASPQVMDSSIGAGDMLEVTETHLPEMHATVRVSRGGTVTLPFAGEVKLEGMDERSAALAIEAVLGEKGILRHPQVSVLVKAYAGLDVSVLGEVARPGVYSYTVHHQLLDLISAASGLSQNAGRLVTISHRSDPQNQVTVVLDPTGTDAPGNHNPELQPGDTVQVARVGLVYVVGDVIRPGGFPVDPMQSSTVLQALSLAWGPARNAALKKAVLIREQAGGRTVMTLNLKRMLRGLDPDMPIRDRDILFVPDSMAKDLLNRTMESVIQSAAGVSIYSGLVYSQRY